MEYQTNEYHSLGIRLRMEYQWIECHSIGIRLCVLDNPQKHWGTKEFIDREVEKR